MEKLTNVKYKVKKIINKKKFQDEIDELRFELASTQIPERRYEIKELLKELEK